MNGEKNKLLFFYQLLRHSLIAALNSGRFALNSQSVRRINNVLEKSARLIIS